MPQPLRIRDVEPIEDLTRPDQVSLAARRALESRVIVFDGVDLLSNFGDLLDKLKIPLLGLIGFVPELPDTEESFVAADGRGQEDEGEQAEREAEASFARLRQ